MTSRIVSASMLISYSLYTFDAGNVPDSRAMMLTIPFVAYGLFRYLYLLHERDLGEEPDRVALTDVPIMATVALWITAAGLILARA